MLTLGGPGWRNCDGVNRRQALAAGALGAGGLTLADLLRAEAVAPPRRPKSVIYVVLAGGPSHIDMWDMKPDAPAEFRGPFRPISTALPGVQICEHLPRQAQTLDQWALVRGIRSVENDHYLSEVYTGLPRTSGQRPAFGSAVSRLAGGAAALPAYVSLDEETSDVFEFERPHYAGPGHAPFRPFAEALADMRGTETGDRLGERKALLERFDRLRRHVDQAAAYGAHDAFTLRAMDILASPAVRDAFDLSQEPEGTLERYGKGLGKYAYIAVGNEPIYDWDPRPVVMARRLVEAGVRVVTLRLGSWDHHGSLPGSIFYVLQTMLPLIDVSLSALVADLRDRGLEEDVLVVVLGEFGRTPKITPAGPGREHWAEAGCALFWGGGLQTGQVIGATDSRAERATVGNVTMQNVVATIYRTLGIDPGTALVDFNGRPQYLLDDRAAIAALGAAV